MKRTLNIFGNWPLYICLLLGFSAVIWGFYQSEQYRTQTNLSLSETYEVLWRCSQIREKAANIGGMIASPQAVPGGYVKRKIQMQSLKIKLAALRGVP